MELDSCWLSLVTWMINNVEVRTETQENTILIFTFFFRSTDIDKIVLDT